MKFPLDQRIVLLLFSIAFLFSCSHNKDYEKDIALVTPLFDIHKNFSIGQRGDLKMLGLKMDKKHVLFKYLKIDESSGNYKINESISDKDLRIMKFVLFNDTSVSIKKEQLIYLIEYRLNKITSVYDQTGITASNGFKDDECVDYIFYYNAAHVLIYMHDTTCKAEIKGNIIYNYKNWIAINNK